MTRLRYNGLSAALGASLGSGATAITFAAALTHSGGTSVPTITGSDYIPLALLDASGVMKEVVYLTAYTSAATTGTVTRGQEGTVSTNVHSSGALVRHGPLALDVSGAGGTTLDALSDVDTSTTPPSAAFQGLVWDGSTQWKPSTVPVVRRSSLVNPSVVQMYEGGGSTSASWTPTGLANGDVLIYAICSQAAVSTPAGMTSIFSDSAWAAFYGGFNLIATKAVGTAENTITVTVSGLNADTRWAAYYIRGLSTVPVSGDAVASARGATSAPYVWAGITASKSAPKFQVVAGTTVGGVGTKINPPPEMLSPSGGHQTNAWQSAGFASRSTATTSTSFTANTSGIPNRIDSVMVTVTLTATVTTSSASPVNALTDLADVNAGSPADKQLLTYDAVNGVWTPTTPAKTVNTQTGTAYTLVLGDANNLVDMNNAAASTLTVPPNSSVAFPVGTIIEGNQLGVGQVTLTPGSGVTINATPGLKVAAQYGTYGLRKTATDTWLAYGRLSA